MFKFNTFSCKQLYARCRPRTEFVHRTCRLWSSFSIVRIQTNLFIEKYMQYISAIYAIYFLFEHAWWYFLISCNLIGCSSGQLFTISWPWSKRVIFSRKTEEWRQFSNSKHYPKSLKIHPIDTKDSKIQWIGFSGLSAKPEMYFSPTKLRKKQI